VSGVIDSAVNGHPKAVYGCVKGKCLKLKKSTYANAKMMSKGLEVDWCRKSSCMLSV